MENNRIEVPSGKNVYDDKYCRQYLNCLSEAEAKELGEFAEWLEDFFDWFPDYRIAHDGFSETGDGGSYHLSQEQKTPVLSA